MRVQLARAALVLALAPEAVASEPPPAPGPGGSTAPLFEPPAPGSYELPVVDRVSRHALLDPAGHTSQLTDLGRGELALVSFIYRSCAEVEGCPLALSVLRRIDRRIGADPKLTERVRLYTVSFDPARDAPERMRELRDALEPRSRWAFLTAASPDAIAPVLRDYGQDVAPWRDAEGHPDGRLVHVLKVFLVDAQGDVRNVYSAGYLDERLVLADVETLLEP